MSTTTTFCPNCAREGYPILESSGWCYECSGLIKRVCGRCNNSFWSETEDFVCNDCKQEVANDIETLMVGGLSFTRAQTLVWEHLRPTCLCCGDPIKHGTAGRHKFCTNRPECRKTALRAKRNRLRKGMTPEAALVAALALYEKEKPHR